MSVKQMTTKQIRDDLETLVLTWPDGIPPQQTDRVNALKAELARRPDAEDASTQPTARSGLAPAAQLDTDVLEAELRTLSNVLGRNPGDDAAQGRFADVRGELRRRAKSDSLKEDAPPVKAARSPVATRDIEMPELPEYMTARASDRRASLASSLADAASGRVMSKRLAVDEVTPVMRKREERPVPKQVKGYSVQVDGDTIVLKHQTRVDDTIAQTVTGMTVEDGQSFILMVIKAVESARANADNG